MPDTQPGTVADFEGDHAHLTCGELAQTYASLTDLYASYGVVADTHSTYADLETEDGTDADYADLATATGDND